MDNTTLPTSTNKTSSIISHTLNDSNNKVNPTSDNSPVTTGNIVKKRSLEQEQSPGEENDESKDNKNKRTRTPREGVPKKPRLPKRKVAVMLGYCGAGYHGMQYNPPSKTIESELFNAFVKSGAISEDNSTDLKKNAFQRAARTDKGVHAGGNVISLKMIIEDPDIKTKINDFLPSGIRIWGIQRVNNGFDSRKACSSRWYEYLLPTYSLLGPKPDSPLYNDLHKITGFVDGESDEFWNKLDEDLKKTFTPEQLDAIENYTFDYKNNGNDKTDEKIKGTEIAQSPEPAELDTNVNEKVYLLYKKHKEITNTHRREYRLSNERLEHFREVMKRYLGAHNFHNFTVGKDFKDPSAIRYMKDIRVSDPFVIENTEWVSIKIHGQSFMLHQIRKMISMATLAVRCQCASNLVDIAFGQDKMNIPKAPALGLLLEHPVYDGYNPRLEKIGYETITFDKWAGEIHDFKMKHIYDKIYAEESEENTFYAFFGYIDSFNKLLEGRQQQNDKTTNFEYLVDGERRFAELKQRKEEQETKQGAEEEGTSENNEALVPAEPSNV
ncbi:pseudouridine synthase PUS1 SCDLUD_001113 [Saccharomycodes ludwigii]|uniref:pseudouridine synthase PUS1 n=1 Tax=Saccharomycodes ludwigii TaxID=36035 RepID=UPI001E86F617|nr:hypothetical protein SCDLUD_001113 [Saccharomycodes ludwigii]KAH3903473.1 hypothetical protein SCDLUD_001113 [Saccharomycodes ludwigii]